MVDRDVLWRRGRVFGSCYFPVITIEVLICEVSIEIFGHMKTSEDAAKESRFVEDLVRNCKVSGIESAVDVS